MSPFLGDSNEEIYEKNKRCEIDFPEDVWKPVSYEAQDLVVKMLESDQYARININGCLEHPWFKKDKQKLARLSSALCKIKKTNTGISKVFFYTNNLFSKIEEIKEREKHKRTSKFQSGSPASKESETPKSASFSLRTSHSLTKNPVFSYIFVIIFISLFLQLLKNNWKQD